MKDIFFVTTEHLKLVRSVTISWLNVECGAPGIDPKRPFGNTDVIRDLCDILEIDESEADEDSLWELYRDLNTCLQIMCDNLSIEKGEYIYKKTINKWVLNGGNRA